MFVLIRNCFPKPSEVSGNFNSNIVNLGCTGNLTNIIKRQMQGISKLMNKQALNGYVIVETKLNVICTVPDSKRVWFTKLMLKIIADKIEFISDVLRILSRNAGTTMLHHFGYKSRRTSSCSCKLCQEEKLAIVTHPDHVELLNERSEIHRNRETLTSTFSVCTNPGESE